MKLAVDFADAWLPRREETNDLHIAAVYVVSLHKGHPGRKTLRQMNLISLCQSRVDDWGGPGLRSLRSRLCDRLLRKALGVPRPSLR